MGLCGECAGFRMNLDGVWTGFRRKVQNKMHGSLEYVQRNGG